MSESCNIPPKFVSSFYFSGKNYFFNGTTQIKKLLLTTKKPKNAFIRLTHAKAFLKGALGRLAFLFKNFNIFIYITTVDKDAQILYILL